MEKKPVQPKSVSDLLHKYDFVKRLTEKVSYSTTEHQDYGLRLGIQLGDKMHRPLYIKLAKELPRGILDQAVSFALDYPIKNLDGNKGKIFMWKLKELCLTHKIELPKVKRKLNKKKEYLKKQITMFK